MTEGCDDRAAAVGPVAREVVVDDGLAEDDARRAGEALSHPGGRQHRIVGGHSTHRRADEERGTAADQERSPAHTVADWPDGELPDSVPDKKSGQGQLDGGRRCAQRRAHCRQ